MSDASDAEIRTPERPLPGGQLLAEALQDPPDESDERLSAMAAPKVSVPTALAGLAAMRADLVPAAASSSSQAEKEEKKTSASTSPSSPSTVDAIQRVEADLTSSLSCAHQVGSPLVACKACEDAALFQSIQGLASFGTGSQKDVYALPASRCIAVFRPSGIGSVPPEVCAQRERQALVEVAALGIHCVAIHDIAKAPDGRVGIVQDRIDDAINSSELPTLEARRAYLSANPGRTADVNDARELAALEAKLARLNQATIDDCDLFIRLLRSQDPPRYIEDFQFLIDAQGRLHATDARSVVVADCQRNVDTVKQIRAFALSKVLVDSDNE